MDQLLGELRLTTTIAILNNIDRNVGARFIAHHHLPPGTVINTTPHPTIHPVQTLTARVALIVNDGMKTAPLPVKGTRLTSSVPSRTFSTDVHATVRCLDC